MAVLLSAGLTYVSKSFLRIPLVVVDSAHVMGVAPFLFMPFRRPGNLQPSLWQRASLGSGSGNLEAMWSTLFPLRSQEWDSAPLFKRRSTKSIFPVATAMCSRRFPVLTSRQLISAPADSNASTRGTGATPIMPQTLTPFMLIPRDVAHSKRQPTCAYVHRQQYTLAQHIKKELPNGFLFLEGSNGQTRTKSISKTWS